MKRGAAWLFPILLVAGVLLFALTHKSTRTGVSHPGASSQTFAATPGRPSTAAYPQAAEPALAQGRRKGISAQQKPQPNTGPGSTATGLPRRRSWDPRFLHTLRDVHAGDPIHLELLKGEYASARVRFIKKSGEELVYITGELIEPAAGRFFFQKQASRGVAGDFVGVIEFPEHGKAYRLEPSGTPGATDLVEREIGQVLCLRLPRPDPRKQIENVPPLKPEDFPDLPIPEYQNGIALLHSLLGATAVLYLDFQGGYTSTWGGIAYARPNLNNAQIRDIWKRVAEDYMPFKIDVTTDLAGYLNAPEASRQRVIITPTDAAAPGQGGVAYLGSFNWTGDTPCWVFITEGKYCADACSHEAGHTLHLEHDGQIHNGQIVEYYEGHGSGELGWAPIMGVGYYRNVVQWTCGEYPSASRHQAELATIANLNNNTGYRTGEPDPRYLELYPDYSASGEGVIEQSGDVDRFRFNTSGGAVSLRAEPVRASPNLAIGLALFDSNGELVLEDNAQDRLSASIGTNVAAGTYFLAVGGSGRGNPPTNGFSAYGSLGYYSITGRVSGAVLPTRFAVPEHATNGTVVGVLPVNNPNHDPLIFQLIGDDSLGTFAIDSSGTVSVSDNTRLDFGTLARNSQLAVQFELFINILNTSNPALSETNRRVVIAVLSVPALPVITQQPQSQGAPAGTNVSFSVEADGNAPYDAVPFYCQWTFDGAILPGASRPVLTLTDVQQVHAGQYGVIVSTSIGSVTSAPAILTVNARTPYVTLHPVSQAAFWGHTVEFRAAAIGSEPLTCQWQLDGVDIPGAMARLLVVSNVRPEVCGNYRAVIRNFVGTTTTEEASLVFVPVDVWFWNGTESGDLPFELTNAVTIAAASDYNLAVLRDGKAVGWGSGIPVPVPEWLDNVVAVAAGGEHALALKRNGTVAAWGSNNALQTDVPPSATNVVAVAAGGQHSLALKQDGTVIGWGGNSDGQTTIPVGVTNVVAIAAGSNFSLALTAEGKVAGWGNNALHQTSVPAGLADVVDVAAGDGFGLALRLDGTVAAWGWYEYYPRPLLPAGLSNVIGIAAGTGHAVAIREDGTLVVWNIESRHEYPVPSTVTNVTAVSCGYAHNVALVGDGAPFIIAQPVGRTAYSGRRVVFRSRASGAWPLSYQWQLNGTSIPGATNQMLVLDWAMQRGNYRVVVRNAFGSVVSSEAPLRLIDRPPFVLSQPAVQ